MTYLITGATGFIGRQLVRQLSSNGDVVNYLARRRNNNFDSQISFHYWNLSDGAPLNSVPRVDAIIHLTGEPVFQRWTEESKNRIYQSRIDGTRKLVEAIGRLRHRPEALITASAIGYYGSRGDEVLTEESGPGSNFLAKLCVDWEAEALKARALGVRVVPVRVATVLGRQGGAFPLMSRPAKLGLGATFGTGAQWMSWIHLKDLIDLLIYAAGNRYLSGPVNGTSLEPVTNTKFTKALAQAMHRPAFFRVPKFAMRIVLGEMAEFLFDSLRVMPEAATRAGFQFRFGSLFEALGDLLKT